MLLPIDSYISVGPIRFGMTVDQVRHILPEKAKPFMKSPDDAHETDAFEELGVYVFYKADGCCEAVEMASPAEPVFREQRLVGKPFRDVETFLRLLDPHLDVDSAGATSTELGVAVYCPNHEENPAEPVESLLAFERDYYAHG